jgi:predicted DNA-binding transcriptional regulator AlpA
MAKKKTPELRIAGDYFDVSEAAAYMKRAKGTVYKMIQRKPNNFPVRYIGRNPIFMISELKEWMLDQTAKV